ncbi:DUF6773 family protein, partial [Streptococcus sp. 10F2]
EKLTSFCSSVPFLNERQHTFSKINAICHGSILSRIIKWNNYSIPIIMAIVVLSILFYSIRCAQIGVRSSNTAYLNFWGVLLVTLLLALVIWIGNYQKFHSIYSGPFDPYFLSVLPITFLFNLPLVAGLNAILIFLSKIEKKRYEAELERLENEE